MTTDRSPEHLLVLLADHLGVDLDVLEIAGRRDFDNPRYSVQHDELVLQEELAAAAEWITEGNPIDPHETIRERTVRLLAARRLRQALDV